MRYVLPALVFVVCWYTSLPSSEGGQVSIRTCPFLNALHFLQVATVAHSIIPGIIQCAESAPCVICWLLNYPCCGQHEQLYVQLCHLWSTADDFGISTIVATLAVTAA